MNKKKKKKEKKNNNNKKKKKKRETRENGSAIWWILNLGVWAVAAPYRPISTVGADSRYGLRRG